MALVLYSIIKDNFFKVARKIIGPSYRPSTFIGSIYHFINRCMKFFFWNISTPLAFCSFARPKNKLLVIYDLSSQPLSIGDLIIFQAGALALSANMQLNKIDFVIVYDSASPVTSDKTYSHINTENIFYFLSSILPVSQINQNLGSLMVIDSKNLLSKFIVDNLDCYEVWPSSWRLSAKDYLYYNILDKVLYKYYKNNGKNIHLRSRPFLTKWAFEFYQKHANSAVPVTINLRNNQVYQQYRNANLDAWLNFFKDCESKYPVKFIVICALNERDERFRMLGNVVYAKDTATGLDQDLALIQNSAIHMGVGSGPISMAWFGENPYLMVNTKYPPGYFENEDMLIKIDQKVSRFCFGTDLQRISSDVETAEFLIEQFSIMMKSISVEKWIDSSKYKEVSDDICSTWLR
jgi:hypothetical protein